MVKYKANKVGTNGNAETFWYEGSRITHGKVGGTELNIKDDKYTVTLTFSKVKVTFGYDFSD